MNRIAVYIVPLVMTVVSFFYIEGRKSNSLKRKNLFAVFMMASGLFINFGSNVFNPKNTTYSTFQADSEALVLNAVNAKKAGIDTGPYGLGYYESDSNSYKSYMSQFGLQGKLFQLLYKVPGQHIICCILTAFVLALLILMISKKYDKILSCVFFMTFLLSPWIVNYAKNLYWVEFTWFLPMLIGLALSFDYDNIKKKCLCYACIFISILVKCLCGYEYITVIMLAEIAFPLIDLFMCLFERDKKKALLIFKTIFIMGVVSLLGFTVAILIHANIRGEGNIIAGIRSIYEKDVLRRTFGGNFEDFVSIDTSELFKASFEASVLKVFIKYQLFSTEIISGVPGELFILLELIPILIFIHQHRINKLQKKDVISYIVFGITCVSWFILGKSHSYIHTPLNFVLWYFGFVQICFYVILKQAISLLITGFKYVLSKELQND